MAMIGWTDAHNHLHDPRLEDPASVVSAMKSAGVVRCVVNATREADWADVAAMARAEPGWVAPAFGIHPWHAHTAEDGWAERLAELLDEHPGASIGECGLDRWVSEPGIEIQMPVFLSHLRVARELDRPLTIHCLKAWEPLFEAFKQCPPPGKFLMHSFGGSIEIARRLMPLGARFSFSGHFLSERKEAVREVFRQLPRDRILLETDAPDMPPPPEFTRHPLPEGLNHPANLPAIGMALADVLGMDAAQLAKLTRANAAELFG